MDKPTYLLIFMLRKHLSLLVASIVIPLGAVNAETFNLSLSVGGNATFFPEASKGFLVADTADDGFEFLGLKSSSILYDKSSSSNGDIWGLNDTVVLAGLSTENFPGIGRGFNSISLEFNSLSLSQNWNSDDKLMLVWFPTGISKKGSAFAYYRADDIQNGTISFKTPQQGASDEIVAVGVSPISSKKITLPPPTSDPNLVDLATAKGTFIGTYYAPSSNDLISQNGQVSITLGKKGDFTGVVILEAKGIKVRGKFDPNGNAVLNLKAPSGGGVSIKLLLDNYVDSVLRIAGTITFKDGKEVDFPCYLVAFDGKSGVFGLTGKVVNTVFQSETGKFGYGFASVTATKDGTLKFAGRLADGTIWTGSARAVRDDIKVLVLPMAIPLYAGKGLLHGEIIVSENDSVALKSEAPLPLIWIRRSDAKSKTYPVGIEEYLNARGSIWAPPKSGSILKLGLEKINLTLDVGKKILGEAGGILKGTWSANNEVAFAEVSKGFSFQVTKATGVFTGKIIPKGGASSKEVTYYGLLFNPALEDIAADDMPLHGAGFITTPNASSEVELTTGK